MLEESLFITGTDTNIGKTYVTACLARHSVESGKKVAVFKPIQTGCEKKDEKGEFVSPDLESVKNLCPQVQIKYSYAFQLPAAPEVAAYKSGIEISFDRIKSDYLSLRESCDTVLVEGAGGLFVPIGKGRTMAHLISFLEVPAILVSDNRLGTINRTCLSAHYAKSCGVHLIGFLFSEAYLSGKDTLTCPEVLETNAEIIGKYTNISFLGCLPYAPLIDDRDNF